MPQQFFHTGGEFLTKVLIGNNIRKERAIEVQAPKLRIRNPRQDGARRLRKTLMAENLVIDDSAKPSVLYDCHIRLGAKSHLAPFAGYLMPLWYSSISAEHTAVRKAAGLFDCTHMGILEVAGAGAEDFINRFSTNDASALQNGKAQYSYVLDADGHILDDIIVYRRADENFMVVVNAANEQKIKDYLWAMDAGDALLRDMRDTKTAGDCRVDIALQGPASIDALSGIFAGERSQLEGIKSFCFIEGKIAGIDCIISRTGYTGAKTGFELLVHPDNAVKVWQEILDKGKKFGVVPCGLGARDSLRIEAGLPLYGHELAGPFDISPFEAGYGWAVKLDKNFFIGKEAIIRRAENFDMQVARIELPGQRGIRPARQNDCIAVNDKCAGWVLSCAKAGEVQIALVYVKKSAGVEGNEIGVHYMPRKANENERLESGENVEADIEGKVLKRFARF